MRYLTYCCGIVLHLATYIVFYAGFGLYSFAFNRSKLDGSITVLIVSMWFPQDVFNVWLGDILVVINKSNWVHM